MKNAKMLMEEQIECAECAESIRLK